MHARRFWSWLSPGLAMFALATLPALQRANGADRAKPADQPADKNADKSDAPIDWEKAKAIHQRDEQGEKLSAEDQAYLERAKAAMARGDGPGQKGNADGIDWPKARALHQREQNGEKLTAEEQAYLDKAKAARAAGAAGGGDKPAGNQAARAAAKPPPAARDSTGMVPLPQLGAEKYKGFDGGLYGGGKNEPPAAHAKAAAAAAAQVVPLDKDGKPDANGKIVLLSIGMSNTTQEFSRFKQIADADADKSASLVIVDGAQGGKAGEAWAKENPGVWEEADKRISSAGVSAKQVQAVWIKQAEIAPSRLGEFPDHAKVLQANIETILQLAKKRFPNLKLAYLSNRIYAGFATTGLNPEPYSYESAFADRWVIEKQIAGDASLNYDPAKGDVKAPIVLWGPYLWADGVKGRELDKLVYTREDLGPDGTHPSTSGRQKVAEQLLTFFKSDGTAKVWFAKK